MDLSRQEYPTLLATLQPNQAVNVLNDRVKLITSINASIADWLQNSQLLVTTSSATIRKEADNALQERRKVEEAYVHGLQKLARRPQQDGAAALGIFQMPWQRIVSGTENLAQSHEKLAQKIETDVETPLRQFATKNREMQSITTIQGNLAAMAKDLESAQKKAERVRDKSGRADKVANASSSVDDASLQWESQAPYVFEQLQSLDETRVNFLRDALTQFQTHEVDQVERNRASAESCLNALLNIETADEIKTFAAKISGGRQSSARRRSSTATGARPESERMAPPATPPSRGLEDSTSSRFGTPAAQDKLMPLDEKSKKSSFGGIKRIGTVMSRRKSAAPPVPSTEKRKEKSRFPFRRADSSRSFHEVDSPPATSGQGLTPVASQDPEPSAPPQPQFTHGETNGLTNTDGAGDRPRTNGNNFIDAPVTRNMDQPLPQIPQELSAASVPQPAPHDENEAPAPSMDPMARAQEEAANTNAEYEETLRNLKIRDQPIAEDETEAQRAMNNMASQLRMQAQNSGQGRMPSVRGRRDVRNTMFVPNPVPPVDARNSFNVEAIPAISTGAAAAVAGAADLVSPIKRAEAPGTAPEDRAVSDSTSVHSGHGLAGLVQHPELHEPGLNASIVETVSTSFSDGKVTRSFVVGEIALAYNQTSELSADAETETIRLENFQDLEKAAANPAFVTAAVSDKGKERASVEDRAGEYSVVVSAIRKPVPTVALKYQLHLDEANLSAYSPVFFTPAWQIQDSQASVIVVYEVNPTFAHTSTTLTLKNVVITVALDTSADAGKAANAMMAPTAGASFKRKQSLVVWRFPELVVDTEQKKLLARFITTGAPPKPGPTETKWELPNMIGSGLSVSTLAAEASDPFADESASAGQTRSWNRIGCAKKLVSGRYSAS